MSYRWRNTTFWLRRVLGQAKFTYFLLRKAWKKQTKTIEDQRASQIQALITLNLANKENLSIKYFIPKNELNLEIENELNVLQRIQENIWFHIR